MTDKMIDTLNTVTTFTYDDYDDYYIMQSAIDDEIGLERHNGGRTVWYLDDEIDAREAI